MKFSATLITIIACATLASSASNDFQERANGLLSTLKSKLEQSQEGSQASELIQNAIRLVKTAAFVGPESEAAQAAMTQAEKILPQVENIINGGPVSRNAAVNALSNLVGQRGGLLGEVLAKFAANMEASGDKPLAAIFKTAAETFQEKVLVNDNMRKFADKVADGIDMVEDAVNLINEFTGGAIPQVNMVANVVGHLNNASDTLLSRAKNDDSRNMIVSKILGSLYKMKNSKNEFAFNALDKVCSKLHGNDIKA